MMNLFRKKNYHSIICFFSVLLLLLTMIGYISIQLMFDRIEEQRDEEISRINEYFKGDFEVYKIPAGVSMGPMRTKVFDLQNINYVLQTEEKVENDGGEEHRLLRELPYYPFPKRKLAELCYSELDSEEKLKFVIVSQSIIYIDGYSENIQKKIKEAADYFDSQEALEEETP